MENVKFMPNAKEEIELVDRELIEKRLEALKKLPRFRGEVHTRNNIRQLKEVEPGDIFWVSSDNSAFIVSDKDRQKLTLKKLDETATISTGISIYDLNKQLVSKEPLFDWEDKIAVSVLEEKFFSFFNEDTFAEYYLLYGRDIHYVSLLAVSSREVKPQCWKGIFEALNNIGQLISIDFNVDKEQEINAEIWIRTKESKAELLYLMPFDNGVIAI